MNDLINLSMYRSRTAHPLLKIKVNFQGNSDYKAALVLFLTIIFCQNICNNNPTIQIVFVTTLEVFLMEYHFVNRGSPKISEKKE